MPIAILLLLLSGAPAKGKPAAGSACWHYTAKDILGQSAVCLRTETEPVHQDGQVRNEFCSDSLAVLHAITAPYHLVLCPGTYPPARFAPPLKPQPAPRKRPGVPVGGHAVAGR